MREIKVKILRGTPDHESYYQDYSVEFEEDKDISVMNILEEIYAHQDPSLAFFSHAACRQAACGKCMVKVDGVIKLACKEKVTADFITLAPYNSKVIKDLVCAR